MPISIKPTQADLAIARGVARHTRPPAETVAKIMTWGADEKILCSLALGWWLFCRGQPMQRRRNSDHLLLTSITASILPHLLKKIFNQTRPDRLTVKGHLQGVPLSGHARDAFPSGHALHIGALASVATRLPPRQRDGVWMAGAMLCLTRIVLLAHWASDVAAGLLLGASIERALRLITGFGKARD